MRIFGPLLTVASATTTKMTAVCARFCMELNLTREYPTEIYLGTEVQGDYQPIVMENRPTFCLECNKRGHVHEDYGRLE